MGKKLNDENEMKMIYKAAKDVYEGECSEQYALTLLNGKTSASTSSLRMYINIYKCMREAKCYKMGTGEVFTKFLLDSIFRDSGVEEYKKALIAVKGNSAYRESVDNAQPGLRRACLESMKECGFPFVYDDLPVASFDYKIDNSFEIDDESEETIINQNEQKHLQPRLDYTTSNGDTIELNIQPAASILNVFSRLSYKAWYAIAEFVDNSTQSYISHKDILDSDPEFEKLIVFVKYDSSSNTLRITDNAYGMEIERFKDAILLDSRNESQIGRNEFGMGLKTAASWFGNVWSVSSSQYGSNNRYTATVDIPELKKTGLNSIKIHRDFVEEAEHGTEILIEDVTKKITASRTIGKIRDLLSSMYRRDINNRNIEIWFNDEPIVFEEYPVLKNFRGKTWKKELDFDVEFNGNKYNVTGFVAIMNPGSFPKSGFALFRQDRVVVGGTDCNYKPVQIFGQAQSQKSLKLFGELNMDDFPVNQAKDGFIWDDGLEDAFVDALKSNIQEYIDIADLSIKERASEEQYSDEASNELQQDVAEAIENAFRVSEVSPTIDEAKPLEDLEENKSDYQEYVDTILNCPVEDEIVGTEREYSVPVSPVIKVDFTVQWAVGRKTYWIEYEELGQDKYNVLINIDHPFFMPFSKDEQFKRVLEKFTIAFILSERQAKLSSDKEGYIPSNVIKNFMNNYLQKLAEDK